MRRFKRVQYPYQRREDVLRCFGNFDDALGENELWELSEKIRPRQRASPSGWKASPPVSWASRPL